MVLLSRSRNSVSSELRRKVENVLKKVEEVSRLSGVSKRTLQYYDDEGILPAKRSEENYRLYDESAMEKLWKILWYKEMGFQLSEIKILLAEVEKDKGMLLEQKIKIISEKILDLQNQREIIRYVEQWGTVRNEHVTEPTIKTIYVGNDDFLKAYITTGRSISDIKDLLDRGATVAEDGTIVQPVKTTTERVDSAKDKEEKSVNKKESNNMSGVIIGILVVVACVIVLVIRKYRKNRNTVEDKVDNQ